MYICVYMYTHTCQGFDKRNLRDMGRGLVKQGKTAMGTPARSLEFEQRPVQLFRTSRDVCVCVYARVWI